MKRGLIAVAAVAVVGACVAPPTDQASLSDLRQGGYEFEEFAVPGFVTRSVEVEAQMKQRCGEDRQCYGRQRTGWQHVRFVALKVPTKKLPEHLALATNDGVTDWERASNAIQAETRSAIEERRYRSTLRTFCSTSVSKNGRRSSTLCSSH